MKIISQTTVYQDNQVQVRFTTDDGQERVMPFEEFEQFEQQLNSPSNQTTGITPYQPQQFPQPKPALITAEEFEERRWNPPTKLKLPEGTPQFGQQPSAQDLPKPQDSPYYNPVLGEIGSDIVYTLAPELTGQVSRKGRHAIQLGSDMVEIPTGKDVKLGDVAAALRQQDRQALTTGLRMVGNAGLDLAQEGSDLIRDVFGLLPFIESTDSRNQNMGFLGTPWPLPYFEHESGNNEWENVGTGFIQFGLGLASLGKVASVAGKGLLRLTPAGAKVLGSYQKLPNVSRSIISGAGKGAAVDFAGFDQYGGRITDAANSIVKGIAADQINFDFMGPMGEGLDSVAEGFVNLFGGDIANIPVVGYLVSDESDSGLTGRFKNMLEGIPIGIVADLGMAGISTFRALRNLHTKVGKFNKLHNDLDKNVLFLTDEIEELNQFVTGDESDAPFLEMIAQATDRRKSLRDGTAPEMKQARKDVEDALAKVEQNALWRGKKTKRLEEAIKFELGVADGGDKLKVRDDQATVAEQDSKNPVTKTEVEVEAEAETGTKIGGDTAATDQTGKQVTQRIADLTGIKSRTQELLNQATKTATDAANLVKTNTKAVDKIRGGIRYLETLKLQAQLDELNKLNTLTQVQQTQKASLTKAIDRDVNKLSDNQLLGLMELDVADIGELRYDQDRLQSVIDTLVENTGQQEVKLDLASKVAKQEMERLTALRNRQVTDLVILERIGQDSAQINKARQKLNEPNGLQAKYDKAVAEVEKVDVEIRNLDEQQARRERRGQTKGRGIRFIESYKKHLVDLQTRRANRQKTVDSAKKALDFEIDKIDKLVKSRDEAVKTYFDETPQLDLYDPTPRTDTGAAPSINSDPTDKVDPVKSESENQVSGSVSQTTQEASGSQPARAVTLETKTAVIGSPSPGYGGFSFVGQNRLALPAETSKDWVTNVGQTGAPSYGGFSFVGQNRPALPPFNNRGVLVGDPTTPSSYTAQPGTALPGSGPANYPALYPSNDWNISVGNVGSPGYGGFSFVGQNRLALPEPNPSISDWVDRAFSLLEPQLGSVRRFNPSDGTTTTTPSVINAPGSYQTRSTVGNLIEVRAPGSIGQQIILDSNAAVENGQLVIKGAPIESNPFTRAGQRFWRSFYSMPEQNMLAAIDNAPPHMQRRMRALFRMKLTEGRLNDLIRVIPDTANASWKIDRGDAGYLPMRNLVLDAWKRHQWANAHTGAAGRFLIGRMLGLSGRFVAAEGITDVLGKGAIDLVTFAPGLVSPILKSIPVTGFEQLGYLLDGLGGAEHFVSGLFGDGGDIVGKLAINRLFTAGASEVGSAIPFLSDIDKLVDSTVGDWVKNNSAAISRYLSKQGELKTLDNSINSLKKQQGDLSAEWTAVATQLDKAKQANDTAAVAALQKRYDQIQQSINDKTNQVNVLESKYKETFLQLPGFAYYTAEQAGQIHARLVNATSYATYGAGTAATRVLRLTAAPLEAAWGAVDLALTGGIDRQVGTNIQADSVFLQGHQLVYDTVTSASEAAAQTVEQVIKDPYKVYDAPTIPTTVGPDFQILTPGEQISKAVSKLEQSSVNLWQQQDNLVRRLQTWVVDSQDLQFQMRNVLESQGELIQDGKPIGTDVTPTDATKETTSAAPTETLAVPEATSVAAPVVDAAGYFKQIEDRIKQIASTEDGWARQQQALDQLSNLYKQVSGSPKAALALLSELITAGDKSAIGTQFSLPLDTYEKANLLPEIVRGQAEQLLSFAEQLPINMEGVRNLLGVGATKENKKAYVGFVRSLKLAATRQIEWAESVQAIMGLKAEADLKIGYGQAENAIAIPDWVVNDLNVGSDWIDVEGINVELSGADKLNLLTQNIGNQVKGRWDRLRKWVKTQANSVTKRYEQAVTTWEDSLDSPDWDRDKAAKEAVARRILGITEGTFESRLASQDTEMTQFGRRLLDVFEIAYMSDPAVRMEQSLKSQPVWLQKLARLSWSVKAANGRVAATAGSQLAEQIRQGADRLMKQGVAADTERYLIEFGAENATRAEQYVSNRAAAALVNQAGDIVASARRLGRNIRTIGKNLENKLPWRNKQSLPQATSQLVGMKQLSDALDWGDLARAAEISDSVVDSFVVEGGAIDTRSWSERAMERINNKVDEIGANANTQRVKAERERRVEFWTDQYIRDGASEVAAKNAAEVKYVVEFLNKDVDQDEALLDNYLFLPDVKGYAEARIQELNDDLNLIGTLFERSYRERRAGVSEIDSRLLTVGTDQLEFLSRRLTEARADWQALFDRDDLIDGAAEVASSNLIEADFGNRGGGLQLLGPDDKADMSNVVELEFEKSRIEQSALDAATNNLNGEANWLLEGNSDARSFETGNLSFRDDGGLIAEAVAVAPVEDNDLVTLIADTLSETPSAAPVLPTSGSVADYPVNQIVVDAKQFQTPGGTVRSDDTYRPQMGRELSVWLDPETNQTVLINGHHRLELAKQSNAETVNVRYVPAATAEEAAQIGAIQNVFDRGSDLLGKATALRGEGVGPGAKLFIADSYGKAGQNVVKLSRLPDELFNKINSENGIPEARGLALGERDLSHDLINTINGLGDMFKWDDQQIKLATYEADDLFNRNIEHRLAIRAAVSELNIPNWNMAASSPQVRKVMSKMIKKMGDDLVVSPDLLSKYQGDLETAVKEFTEVDLGLVETDGTPVSTGLFDILGPVRAAVNESSSFLNKLFKNKNQRINQVTVMPEKFEGPWPNPDISPSQIEPRKGNC